MLQHSATTESPYHFVDCGLPGVTLAGISYYVCENGHVAADIPALEQLLRLIARDIVGKPDALTGDEIRFLRKRLQHKATDFAKAVSVKPESLSRIENGHSPAGPRVDRLVRFYYTLRSGDSVLVRELTAELDKIIQRLPEKRKSHPAQIAATMSADHKWHTKAA